MKVLAAFQMMDSVLPDDARSLAALALRLGGTAGEGALLLCDAPPENGKGPALPGEIILYRVNRDEPFLPDSDSFRRALLACMEEFSPEIILLPHGTFYLPAAAAAARARGCRPVTGIESLQKQGEKVFGEGSTSSYYWYKLYSDKREGVIVLNRLNAISLSGTIRAKIIIEDDWGNAKTWEFYLKK